jgi:DNA repair protein RadA/Sms
VLEEASHVGNFVELKKSRLGKGAKRPKGIEVVTINSVDQLPRALFVE